MDCPCTPDRLHVPTLLGTWGGHDHFRCRMCGWDWSEEAESDEPEDNDEDGRFATDAEADEDAVSGGVPDHDEWDGQPDEMQEWHDFDPDC